MSPIILIPAYCPIPALVPLVLGLQKAGQEVIVVDDGSDASAQTHFECLKTAGITILEHATNLGKGAALKTGLNYIACHYRQSVGVVTADADGQHTIEDILRVCRTLEQQPHNLILGVRDTAYNPENKVLEKVPFRSRFGNSVTKVIFNFLTGLKLKDTQTGLRGIPLSHIKHYLTIVPNKYEFELDMLLTAQRQGHAITQVPIQTVYIDGNQSSHFNPLLDSARIYFVLLRFICVSVLSALLDYMIFILCYYSGASILISQYTARLISGTFNYNLNRKGVFAADNSIGSSLPRYILLASLLSFCGVLIIEFLVKMHMPVAVAKPLAEGLLFIASFSIQRSFVFVQKTVA